MSNISIVHWYSDLENHNCGYCKNENGSISYGMWAERLTIEDYQNLIDRGWRRSGMYCYKPIMNQTCCPLYTIRCNAENFQLSKSQKKVIKKLNKYLGEGRKTVQEGKLLNMCMEMENDDIEEKIILKERPNVKFDLVNLNTFSSVSVENEITKELIDQSHNDHVSNSSIPSSSRVNCNHVIDIETKTNFKKGKGADPNKPLCKKAKLLRLEKKLQKLIHNDAQNSSRDVGKSLEQILNEIPIDSKHKIKFKLISSNKLEEELEHDKNEEFKIYKKYQTIIHNDPPEKCSMLGFTRFLISSPLKTLCEKKNNSVINYGSFHQQYWIDDKLIAVAVLDILPHCVSSVYFFYDPDYRFLTLGTYASLREIYLTQTLCKSAPSIRYYYMGFYVHTCPKMRYKGKLNNSFLLCPETYAWFPIERSLEKLEKNKYSRLNDDLDALDENLCTDNDVDNIKVYNYHSFTIFRNYKRVYGDQDVFDNIGKLIGKKCASEIIFKEKLLIRMVLRILRVFNSLRKFFEETKFYEELTK